MKRLAFLLAMSGLYLGCQSVPKLTDYRVPRDMDESRSTQLAAPIVIVGTIEADVPVGPRVKSRWDPIVMLQLHRMQVHIENVLRGDLKLATVPVYYFMIDSTYDGPLPLGKWQTGKRRLFFVRRDAGVLRLACDLSNHCAFTVATGSHPNFRRNPNEPLDAALADLYLTKGQGISDADFADAVGRYGDNIPRQYAVPKLRILAASANPDIHHDACYVLKNSFSLPCETPTPQTKH